MSSQEKLEALISQLQAELNQMHIQLTAEVEKSNKFQVKCNAFQEQLIQNQKLLSQIIDTTQNPIFAHDADGQFLLVNQAFAEICNTSTEQLIGKNHDLFKIAQPQIEHLLKPNQEIVSITEEYLVLPTGESRCFQINKFSVAFDNHNINYTLCIFFDITANKLLEDKINSYSKNEAKLREFIRNFITITSHEFRTPLTTILGSTELLRCYGKNWTEERVVFHLNRIQSSVQHLVLILDNLLFLEDNL
jgi:PAS domain S-box-containing protein